MTSFANTTDDAAQAWEETLKQSDTLEDQLRARSAGALATIEGIIEHLRQIVQTNPE